MRSSSRLVAWGLRQASRLLVVVAAICLVCIVGLVVADVTARALFNAPIYGSYEIVGLLLAPVAFLPIAENLIRDQHLTVEIIDQFVRKRVLARLRLVGLVAVFVFAAILAAFAFGPTRDSFGNGEVSLDLEIPAFYRASAVYLGIVAAAVAAAVLAMRELTVPFRRGGD